MERLKTKGKSKDKRKEGGGSGEGRDWLKIEASEIGKRRQTRFFSFGKSEGFQQIQTERKGRTKTRITTTTTSI